MNSKTKRRLVVVTGVVIMVLCIILAVVGGNNAAKTISIDDALQGTYAGDRVQVTGNVEDDSFALENGVLTFSIFDPETKDQSQSLCVNYEGSASSTFGNGITTICTGTLSDDGKILNCTELVTKCPSKYESSDDVLAIERLLGYGEEIMGKPVKALGSIVAGSLQPAGGDVRFVVADAQNPEMTVSVHYDGALSDEMTDGAEVVLSGSLTDADTFTATDVALKG